MGEDYNESKPDGWRGKLCEKGWPASGSAFDRAKLPSKIKEVKANDPERHRNASPERVE